LLNETSDTFCVAEDRTRVHAADRSFGMTLQDGLGPLQRSRIVTAIERDARGVDESRYDIDASGHGVLMIDFSRVQQHE
jgi:hypothetical protein